MCENVNINVSETNETINIVATEVQEVIDINVFETAEDVTLNITEQLIQVNVNKVTAAEQIQSDWAQTDNEALDFIKNKPTIPTNTSDLINDGEDGVNPFITANDIPPVTGFVPYTGATEDVNLGEFGLLTGNVEFDNTPTNIPTTAGAMYWNDADGTADLILKGGNVKLQVGQESVIRVVNKTATNINLLEANYQAVRVTGAQGQRLKVDLAQATNDNLSAETIGLVTETINNNQEGFITTSGLVRNINTTGSLQGETWADGDILYLSATTAGNVTKVKPTAPNHLVIIGYVVHAHANQGSIFVKVDNGYELDELHNVKITSAANNNVLAYTSATDIWENKTVETALGFTPENVANKSTSTSLGTSNTLYPTQNAVKVYADTKFTLPSLTSGSVLFSNGTTIAQKNANFFWDDTNNRLGIGTTTPATALDVNGTVKALALQTTDLIANSPTQIILVKNSSGTISARLFSDGSIFRISSSGQFNALSVFANGNLGVNQTTDAGFKLDVNGTARVSGALTLGGSVNLSSDSTLSIGNSTSRILGLYVRVIASGNNTMDLLAPAINFADASSNIRLKIFSGTGNVQIQNAGTYTDEVSARLTVNSTTQGFLPPRMTTTQKNAIATPAAGLVVYDTTDNKHYGYNGTTWNAFY